MKRLTVAALFAATCSQAGELKLELDGEGLAGHQVRVGIFSANAPEEFPSDERTYRAVVSEATSDQLTVTVLDLPPGRYAVAAYVDRHRTGRLERNFMGIPNEIYGFSNNVRGILGPPEFSAAAFEVGESVVTKSIHLY